MLAVIDQIELPDDDPSGEGDDVLDELQLTFRALGEVFCRESGKYGSTPKDVEKFEELTRSSEVANHLLSTIMVNPSLKALWVEAKSSLGAMAKHLPKLESMKKRFASTSAEQRQGGIFLSH